MIEGLTCAGFSEKTPTTPRNVRRPVRCLCRPFLPTNRRRRDLRRFQAPPDADRRARRPSINSGSRGPCVFFLHRDASHGPETFFPAGLQCAPNRRPAAGRASSSRRSRPCAPGGRRGPVYKAGISHTPEAGPRPEPGRRAGVFRGRRPPPASGRVMSTSDALFAASSRANARKDRQANGLSPPAARTACVPWWREGRPLGAWPACRAGWLFPGRQSLSEPLFHPPAQPPSMPLPRPAGSRSGVVATHSAHIFATHLLGTDTDIRVIQSRPPQSGGVLARPRQGL